MFKKGDMVRHRVLDCVGIVLGDPPLRLKAPSQRAQRRRHREKLVWWLDEPRDSKFTEPHSDLILVGDTDD
jgi:hypothetical protein